jgi:FimV-like protein
MSNIFYYSSLFISFAGLCLIMQIIHLLVKPQHIYHLEDGEYDFLSDQSSEQSRLDLAHAYLEMGQLQTAKKILRTLKHSSDINIRERAVQAIEKNRL